MTRQPLDQVLHAWQHTCVSLLPGLSRPDLQVQAVLWESSGPSQHYLEPPVQHSQDKILLGNILGGDFPEKEKKKYKKKKERMN